MSALNGLVQLVSKIPCVRWYTREARKERERERSGFKILTGKVLWTCFECGVTGRLTIGRGECD